MAQAGAAAAWPVLDGCFMRGRVSLAVLLVSLQRWVPCLPPGCCRTVNVWQCMWKRTASLHTSCEHVSGTMID